MDPNRNFDYYWAGPGSSNVHCSETYHGEEALSEPELQAATEYVQSLNGAVKYYQNIHSAANLIMYPWAYSTTEVGCNNEENPDAADQDALGLAVCLAAAAAAVVAVVAVAAVVVVVVASAAAAAAVFAVIVVHCCYYCCCSCYCYYCFYCCCC